MNAVVGIIAANVLNVVALAALSVDTKAHHRIATGNIRLAEIDRERDELARSLAVMDTVGAPVRPHAVFGPCPHPLCGMAGYHLLRNRRRGMIARECQWCGFEWTEALR